MSALADVTDPTDLPALRAALAADDPEGRLDAVELDRMVVAADAIESLADVVAQELTRAGREGTVVVLVDATPIERAGADLKAQVHDLLATRFTVSTTVLRGSHSTLHVDDEALDAATEALTDAACVVSVGGGTISDIAKVASARSGGVPHVVVPTAASVDGYTDNLSVVLRDGVKRTVESRWPDVVLADLTTMAQAPARLTASGFGEVQSTFCAPADWYLAAAFGMDDWDPAPGDMVAGAARDIETWAPGVARHEPEAVERLVRLLAARGVAGGIVGSTACLSGTEHLISHMLDMFHDAHDKPVGLHGAQVGVASVVSTAAWEHLLTDFDPAKVDLDALFPDPETRRETLLAAFADLDPSGKRGEECWNDYRAKLEKWAQCRPTIEAALADWDRHRAVLDELLAPPRTLGATLVAGGAAARFADLDPAPDEATARWAVANCHLMRNRFTVVDLLDLLGRWTDADHDAVLAAVGKATTGEPGEAA